MAKAPTNTNKVIGNVKKDSEKTVVTQNTEDQGNAKPVFDKDGAIVEQNVFPPLDDDATFEGTGAGQRQLRAQKEAQDKANEE